MAKVEKRVSFVELWGHEIGLIGMNGRAEIVLMHLTFIEMIDFHAGIPLRNIVKCFRKILYKMIKASHNFFFRFES